MKTLNVSISERELIKFGIKKDKIRFDEFVDLISRELAKQALERTVKEADNKGLSKMSIDDISTEVKAVRKHGKSRS